MAKTVREFEVSMDIWPTVEKWAQGQFFFTYDVPILGKGDPNVRTYRSGTIGDLAAAYIRIILVENTARIEGWKTPGEQPVESTPLMGAANPGMLAAKSAYDDLLKALGQPSLDSPESQPVGSSAAMHDYVTNKEQQQIAAQKRTQLLARKILPWLIVGLVVMCAGSGMAATFSQGGEIAAGISFLAALVIWVVGIVKTIQYRKVLNTAPAEPQSK